MPCRHQKSAYGLLTSCWGILHKKTDMKKVNLKYIVVALIILHNLCIARCHPCKPRWKLTVEQLGFSKREILCQPNKKESMKIPHVLQIG